MGQVIKGIVCIAILAGVAWFWMRYYRLKEARETYNQAVAAINSGKPDEAIPLLDKAMTASHGDAELQLRTREHYAKAYAAVAERHLAAKDFEKAYAAVKEMETKCPDDIRQTTAYGTLVRAAYETGRDDEAIAAGKLAIMNDENMEAKLWLSRAEKRKRGYALAAQAKKARDTKNVKAAIAAYEELVKDDVMARLVTARVHPYYYLAELYLGQKEADKAAAMLTRARENDPAESMLKFYDTLEAKIAATTK